jgi:hypothetical protein
VDLEAKYTTWFGASNPSGIRRKLKDYKEFCDTNTCKITDGNAGKNFFNDGVNRVKQCKERVDNARTNWGELGQFANAYLKTASQLTSFMAQAVGIFHLASFCDPFVYADDVIFTKCKWIRAIEDLSSKVSRIQTRALYLDTIMRELPSLAGGRITHRTHKLGGRSSNIAPLLEGAITSTSSSFPEHSGQIGWIRPTSRANS